ncbi:hypothetical protein Tsubulata_018875 [Turnera subulata]|uniref:DUF3730 domain-containing protein n=1 Tax=Turnera subulata TaxID=218843 RepID=A0A9Q0FP89_9ROSI|nr:hypothetical protein Tsubulata_018875 [Turnera subulata]
MDSYTPLLEKTRVPQPSLQKFAVTSIFSKLRSAPTHLGPDSEPGRDAITRCLHSASPAVVDQSVREVCRLVSDSKWDLSTGFLELQSALEGSEPKFVGLFVKALGFLVRFGFERRYGPLRSVSPDNHPFIKILSCRIEVQSELVRQVLLFMEHGRRLGMPEVCEFLRPFLNFSILRISVSDSSSSFFARQLVSSMAAFCCSYAEDAMPVLKLLMRCLKFVPHKNSDELRDSYCYLESIVESYTVVLRQLVGMGLSVTEAQLFGVELSETILSLLAHVDGPSSGRELIIELVKRLFVVQKDLALQYIAEISSAVLSLFVVLIQSEVEHEQLSLLKLLIFLMRWKGENGPSVFVFVNLAESSVGESKRALNEELLLTFPVINLLSSASRSTKRAAAELLVILEKLLMQFLRTPKTEPVIEGKLPSISSLGSMTFRLLQHLWLEGRKRKAIEFVFGAVRMCTVHHAVGGLVKFILDEFSCSNSFLNFASSNESGVERIHSEPRPWSSQLREYCLLVVDRNKSSIPIPQLQRYFSAASCITWLFCHVEMPMLLSAIASIMVMHRSLGDISIDLLAAVVVMDPKLGVPLLLAVLFYCNIFSRKDDSNHRNILPKLLSILPSLASHSAMIPLIVQTILPMLQKDGKPVLYATGARLLCHTWMLNDRAFGSLQPVLQPKGFNEFKAEKNICLSLAASILDVCGKDPDRGVDLILSVSACIESTHPNIQALGLQSLAHLCEADVVDFYTAWDVIAKHVRDYSADPFLAKSLCLLLKWGAMDAEAYLEASRDVLQILWDIASSRHVTYAVHWAKARSSAFEALMQYEVSHIEKGIPDFKRQNSDLLLSEKDLHVLGAMEGFQVKIIIHEHMTQRRVVKEKKVAANKIEKLLDVLPQVLFSSGKMGNPGQLPGAALLCLSFAPKSLNTQQLPKVSADAHAAYLNALVEIASSLQLSRNVFLALLSLQSWKSFMSRWMRANILSLDAKRTSVVSDKTSKAANGILKSLIQLAKDSIPRSAENIALAIGALCVVLPPSAHNIKTTASKFLLNWVSEYEHEHRQWSAAISLGLVSSCLHITDHKQKYENITGLIEVLCGSKSTLVKGACGLGLGFSCQDLLTQEDASDNVNLEKEKHKTMEYELVGKIIRTLLLMTRPLSQASYDVLECLSAYFPLGANDMDINMNSESLLENCEDLEEDIWGVAGFCLGLGSSVGAIYRAQAYDVLMKIKDLIVSWVPHVNSLLTNSAFSGGCSEKVLSVGSCLALPIVVAFCQRVEMMRDSELDHIVNGYRELISELVSVKKSGSFHQSLLMASCIGAGSLVACISNEGVHPMEISSVRSLLELFRKCYSNPFPPAIHLGGMIGVVNAAGACAGILVDDHHFSSLVKTGYEQKESSYVLGPLLSSPICEPYLTTLLQDIFLVAQSSDDLQLQQNAAWAVSFLRNRLWLKESLRFDNTSQNDITDSKTVSHSLSEDSLVMKLSMWLMDLNYSEAGTFAHMGTVITVLECLSRAPRLPNMDWGVIIRRCMRYDTQITNLLPSESACKRGLVREACLKFSVSHASQFDPLLLFLDELSDLSRFRTLELNLQSCVLFHLAGLVKIFSASRLQKLFDDVAEFFSLDTSYQRCTLNEKTSLRISCWKGLFRCLDEASLSSVEYISNVGKCMEVLFSLLPASESAITVGSDQQNSVDEWYEAVKCLTKAPGDWLSKFLQVQLLDLGTVDSQLNDALKKILAEVKLARTGSLPLTVLGKLKAYILNTKPTGKIAFELLQLYLSFRSVGPVSCRSQFLGTGIWNILVEVVAALQYTEGSMKRQWLIDAVEISCMSRYPSTALQFLGLLSGCCSKYMPLLILDRLTVLADLPVTLPSLLREPGWEVVAESIASNLWVSTDRMYRWVTQEVFGDRPSAQPIDPSEYDIAAFLLPVMHHTCVSLKEYLPLDKQLGLANMVVN